MNFDLNLWYVKWFFWNLKIQDRILGVRSWKIQRISRYSQGTNICHFFRTLVLGSIVVAATLATYSWVIFVFLILPFILFHATNILEALAIAMGTIAIGCIMGLTVLGIGIGSRKAFEYAKDWVERKEEETGFFTLMMKYIVSMKQKVCLTISFKRK